MDKSTMTASMMGKRFFQVMITIATALMLEQNKSSLP
jgi:hypothetical protein